MKKTFDLTHAKIKYPRLVEAAKSDVRKYLKRERRRELPEGVDFLAFDCRFGPTEAEAVPVHEKELMSCINNVESQKGTTFYVEILSKPGIRKQKPIPETKPETDLADVSPKEPQPKAEPAPPSTKDAIPTDSDPWAKARRRKKQ